MNMDKKNFQAKVKRLLALRGTWKDTPQDRADTEWVKQGWEQMNERYNGLLKKIKSEETETKN